MKSCSQWNHIPKQVPHNLILCYIVSLKYYIIFVLRSLLFDIHVTCRGAGYPMVKAHTPHRNNRIIVFNHCVVNTPQYDWNQSCWNTTAASQQDADLEAASVQQSAENYLSLCKQRNRYQTGEHTLHHPYIIDINFCKILVVPWFRRLVAQRRISLATRKLGFVADKVALGQVSYEYILFYLSTSWHQPFTFVLHLSSKQNYFSSSKLCTAF